MLDLLFSALFTRQFSCTLSGRESGCKGKIIAKTTAGGRDRLPFNHTPCQGVSCQSGIVGMAPPEGAGGYGGPKIGAGPGGERPENDVNIFRVGQFV